MRTAKIPGEVVYQKVWASLCARMDPETHRVRPSWLTMMREIHVCRQRIADAVNSLKAEGKDECTHVLFGESGARPEILGRLQSGMVVESA